MSISTLTSRRTRDKCQSFMQIVKASRVVKRHHLVLGPKDDQHRMHALCNQNTPKLVLSRSSGLIPKSLGKENLQFVSSIQDFFIPFPMLLYLCCGTQSKRYLLSKASSKLTFQLGPSSLPSSPSCSNGVRRPWTSLSTNLHYHTLLSYLTIPSLA